MSASDTPVLAIRPEPGLSSTLTLGRNMGLNMDGYALCKVKAVDWNIPTTGRFDALLVGSANAMRLGGANLSKLVHLPVHAVGEATAREARAAGFSIERLGKGGLQTVLDALISPIHYLRLVGNEYVDLAWPEGVTFEPVQVYEMEPSVFPSQAVSLLKSDPIVLLHSAAMTRQFVSECERLGVDTSRITLAAMGERIVEPARARQSGNWAGIHTSSEPNDEALLALVRGLCQ